MLPDPDLFLTLDTDIAVGRDIPGLLVDADLVSGQESAAVSDHHPVGSPAQARLEIKLRPALIGKRLHFPLRLLLGAQRAGKGHGAQGQREHGAVSCHLVPRANQNPGAVPSGICADSLFICVHPWLSSAWINLGGIRPADTRSENRLMAAKVKILTLLQEIRGFAQIANRCPPPAPPDYSWLSFSRGAATTRCVSES